MQASDCLNGAVTLRGVTRVMPGHVRYPVDALRPALVCQTLPARTPTLDVNEPAHSGQAGGPSQPHRITDFISPFARSTMGQARVVGILGGMGPAAGADFARLFVHACAEHMGKSGVVVSDQAFPEHWLAQVPVP